MTNSPAAALSRTVRIGLVQARARVDTRRNLDATAGFVEEAAGRGAEIVCLQELFPSAYFARTEDASFFDLAERIPGSTSRFLAGLAAEHGITIVGGSFFEKAQRGSFFNTTLVYDAAGKRVGKYRKVHIPEDPGYHEQYYFTPGNLGYVRVSTPKAVIAPLICYDQWFPEAARLNALGGAEILFYPTAIGWSDQLRAEEPFSADRWEDAMRAHASMNGVFVAAVNRVGREGDLRFWGGSFIADPFGQVIARASRSREEILVADIDLSLIRASQDGWGFLRNRRPETYRKISR